MKNFKWSEAGPSFKFLTTFFLLIVAGGYVFGLIHIYNDVGMSYTGIVTHYRGDTKELAVPAEFAFARLIHVHHVHLFGVGLLFFLVGAIFVLTELPEAVKVVCVTIPFVAMALDFTSFWLLTFVSPIFAFLAMTFGGLMAASFFLIIGRPLYEMWVLPVWRRVWGENTPRFLR